ncbi:MAG: NAD(P)/FAD-dependent oxidoreductase [Chthoniobacterales bacterium]
MELFDVAIIGAGPAGSSCAAFCAASGLRTGVIEREKFPREKVCGDCLNPACWAVLHRLELVQRVRALPHARLERVEFIAISGRKIVVDLPSGDDEEISIKRSLFDNLLLNRARDFGAEIREQSIVTALSKGRAENWKIDIVNQIFGARVLVGADGRNSTVARLCNLLPRPERERVALQAHIPLPRDFGNRIVLQLLPEGYSGQAPVNENELNLCLVGTPPTISALRKWAERHFKLAADQPWRTITPLTRAPIPVAHENLLFIGDAARVVEPFTGEGIFYALRSGELAAEAITKIIRGEDRQLAAREFTRAHAAMYRGRLWINRLARAAVLSPRMASQLISFAPLSTMLMRLLTREIVATAL